MAVFKQELNWSTYQDKQMDVLKSIEKSLSSSLKISQSLQRNMDKIEYAITSIAYASEASAKNLSAITKDLIGHATEFNSRMDKASESTSRLTRHIDTVGEGFSDLREEIQSTRVSIRGMADFLVDKLGSIGQKANEFSEASNQMIRLSGMSGAVVREFRSEILSIVRDLNMDTGSAYSPMESYQQMISISQGVTSNLEAIEEMARPLLLTQEALDVNINSVATLFNRFYTRYTFSSEHMEDTLDSIRGNTAGNAANAEATMQNIDALKNIIDNAAGDDNDLRERLLEGISNYTAWIESMEMDSSKFTAWYKSAAYGDFRDTGLNTVIGYSGKSQYEIGQLARAGESEAVTQAFMDGVYNMMSQFESDGKQGLSYDELGPIAQTMEAMGHDVEFMLDTYNAITSGAYQSLDDFLLSQAATPNMEELVEDKFYTLQTKANNWLENIYGLLASIQEYLPFGFSDIAIGLLLFRNLFGNFSGGGMGNFLGSTSSTRTVSSFSSILGSDGNPLTRTTTESVPGTGILGLLEKGGANLAGASGTKAAALGGLGIAGVGAGLGLGIDGITGLFDDSNNTGTKIFSGVEAAGGLVGAGALTAGLLGAGAAAGPIGWVALAIGGAALLGKNLYKAATTIGETKAIEDAYDQAAASVLKKSKDNENVLLEIKSGLEHEKDLNEMMRDLIDSNILTESDRIKAVKAAQDGNREALIELTNAYLKATGQFNPEYQNALNEYERSDKAYAEELKKSMVSALQEWNNEGKLIDGSEELAAADSLFYSLYKGLQEQQADGVTLDKSTKKIFDQLTKVYESGDFSLSGKEASKIMNAGFLGTAFKNSNLGVENIMNSALIMSSKNSVGSSLYNSIMPSGTYYGSDEASHVLELAYKAMYATSADSAKEYLDQLESEGYSRDKYKEIGEAATKWGLTGYAEGTNYITKDQIAVLHEGEAITPKKYNPMANLNELESLREQSRHSQKEMKEEVRISQEYMKHTYETLSEIRDFLSRWKEDNIKRETAKENRNKFYPSSRFLSNYAREYT